MSLKDPHINSRLISVGTEQDKGTVRFIGSVEGTKGTWLGVQWDDLSRGKHDGSHQGKRYFEASGRGAGTSCCSFIRPPKVASYGCSLREAVIERYSARDADLVTDICVGSKQIELVGMQNIASVQSATSKLRTIALDKCSVAYAIDKSTDVQEEESWLSAKLANCRALDLADNLITEWDEILHVVRLLPKIGELNLTKNCMSPISSRYPCETASDHNDKITILVLNECGIDTWKEVDNIILVFRSVHTLGLSRNPISRISVNKENAQFFNNITTLDLEGISVQHWEDVLGLTWLQRLKSLNLARTQLDKIDLDQSHDGNSDLCSSPWPQLEELYIHKCRIENWLSISALDRLPKLQRLVVLGNPVLNLFNNDTSRQLVIARVGRLKFVDRVEVSPAERRGAEIDYIARYGADWAARGENLREFTENHPRYAALVEDPLVTCHFSGHLSTGGIGARPHKVVRIPDGMSVGRLRALAARHVKARHPSQVSMRLSCGESDVNEIELENDLRQVRFYSVQNGDVIKISAA